MVTDVSTGSTTSASVTITGTGGAVNAGNGANSGDAASTGVHIAGSMTVEEGSSLAVTGSGGALNASNATPGTGNDVPNTQGVRISGGAVIAGIGDADLTFTGTGGTVTAGSNRSVASFGVNIGSNESETTTTLSVQDGTLTITGTAGSSPSLGAGVVLRGTNGGQVVLEGTPDEDGVDGTQIAITGTGGSGYTGSGTFSGNYVPNDGVIIADNVSITDSFGVSISGKAGANSNGVAIVNLSNDPALDAAPISARIQAENISIASTGTAGNVLIDAGLNASDQITITSPGTLTLEDSGGTGGFSTENLTINTQGAILIDNAIAGAGTDTIASANGNITLGTNAALADTGTANVLTLAAGTDLPHSHYLVNDSSLGTNVITVANGAQFDIFQADSASNTADNVNFTVTNTQFGATFPETNLGTGNGLLYFVGNADDRGPNSPLGPFPTGTTPPNLIDILTTMDGSGSNLLPVSVTPQNPDVTLPNGSLPGNGGAGHGAELQRQFQPGRQQRQRRPGQQFRQRRPDRAGRLGHAGQWLAEQLPESVGLLRLRQCARRGGLYRPELGPGLGQRRLLSR